VHVHGVWIVTKVNICLVARGQSRVAMALLDRPARALLCPPVTLFVSLQAKEGTWPVVD